MSKRCIFVAAFHVAYPLILLCGCTNIRHGSGDRSNRDSMSAAYSLYKVSPEFINFVNLEYARAIDTILEVVSKNRDDPEKLDRYMAWANKIDWSLTRDTSEFEGNINPESELFFYEYKDTHFKKETGLLVIQNGEITYKEVFSSSTLR